MQRIMSRTRPSILGTPAYPAPLTIADWSGRRPVFDGAHNRRQHCPCNAATGHLADDAADIRRRGGIGEQRDQHAEDLPPTPPPTAPAMVFPSVPRSIFLAAPAATFPPTAPLMICMIRSMSTPDMARYSPIRWLFFM